MCDLHLHTTASDGQHSPAETVRLAVSAGLDQIAITDHDTVDGVGEARAAAAECGITCLPGIEISVKGNRELHILGYCIDTENPGLAGLCAEFARVRAERGDLIMEYLAAKGVHLDNQKVKARAGHGRVGRPHFAAEMVEAGYAATRQEVFDNYLGTPEFDAVERPKPAPEEGIKMITGAGGVAVLAHPALLRIDEDSLDRLLAELVGYGLGGIECFYSRHIPQQVERYLALAKKYDLLVTQGSDYHGEQVKPDIKLGSGVNGPLGWNEYCGDMTARLQARAAHR